MDRVKFANWVFRKECFHVSWAWRHAPEKRYEKSWEVTSKKGGRRAQLGLRQIGGEPGSVLAESVRAGAQPSALENSEESGRVAVRQSA